MTRLALQCEQVFTRCSRERPSSTDSLDSSPTTVTEFRQVHPTSGDANIAAALYFHFACNVYCMIFAFGLAFAQLL